MTPTAKIVTGSFALAALSGIGFLPLLPPDPRVVAAAHAETERVFAEAKAESEARYREAYIRHVYITHGDTAGDLYVRCTGAEPPKQPANQAKCKVLLDRLQREDEAAGAADAKAKANW
jgi:hypothetical protein